VYFENPVLTPEVYPEGHLRVWFLEEKDLQFQIIIYLPECFIHLNLSNIPCRDQRKVFSPSSAKGHHVELSRGQAVMCYLNMFCHLC
jgi:hypothetical protein